MLFDDGTFLNNSLNNWAIFILAFVLSLTLLVFARKALTTLLSKYTKNSLNRLDDYFVLLVDSMHVLFLTVASIYIATQFLSTSDKLDSAIAKLFVIAFILQGTFTVTRVFHKVTQSKKSSSDIHKRTTIAALSFLGDLILWSIGLLLILDNLGVNIGALVAGLGIGGIAVALALQNVLGDLFSSLSIVLDKPFELGDFIVAGNEKGTVEKVGLKTTRIKSLTGEQIIIANTDMLQSRVRNFKRMFERRVIFTLNLVYSTPVDSVKKIPLEIKRIIESTDNLRFDRAHFSGFGESSLDFEVVYFVLSPEYNLYMDLQQKIYLEILELVPQLKSDFAFPTRTYLVSK